MTWLDDPACRNAVVAGNKAATLARLRQRGYDVPDGFCVTPSTLHSGEDVWRPAVTAALRKLRAPWAVRSSSSAEDSESAAFPGLFLTVLDLEDEPSVLEAIRTVRASRDTELVRKYANHHGIDPASITMSVLVQTLVVAEAAGVAFSFDPVSGAPDVTIEANYGFGETVVDGTVVPDTYWVSDDHVVRHEIGSKRHKVVATTSAARIRRLATSKLEQSARVLDDEQAVAVAELTRRLEHDLRQPVDVEWAFERGRLHLLQSRPVTTLRPSRGIERQSR